MGKAIYQPTGKAREYAGWACNLHVGCSNDCSYCYCKRGVLGTVMGKPQAALKGCFRDETDAFLTFQRELMRYRERIVAEGGLFFSFSTDPCLPETIALTMMCVALATGADVPCLLLTKRVDWVLRGGDELDFLMQVREKVSVGFTLTGCDELEPGASSNDERIEAMRRLHDAGFRTFASIEPVIDFSKAEDMVLRTRSFCDEYKIGLLSGDRNAYAKYGNDFWYRIDLFVWRVKKYAAPGAKILWKKSITDVVRVD